MSGIFMSGMSGGQVQSIQFGKLRRGDAITHHTAAAHSPHKPTHTSPAQPSPSPIPIVSVSLAHSCLTASAAPHLHICTCTWALSSYFAAICYFSFGHFLNRGDGGDGAHATAQQYTRYSTVHSLEQYAEFWLSRPGQKIHNHCAVSSSRPPPTTLCHQPSLHPLYRLSDSDIRPEHQNLDPWPITLPACLALTLDSDSSPVSLAWLSPYRTLLHFFTGTRRHCRLSSHSH